MPNDELMLNSIPVGDLGLVPLKSCTELGKKVDDYLVSWRSNRVHNHESTMELSKYKSDSYIVDAEVPRFGTGEAKGILKQSIRGYDLYIMVDVTKHSLSYKVCGNITSRQPLCGIYTPMCFARMFVSK